MSHPSDIINRFTYHPPRNEREIKAYEVIREAGKKLAWFLNEICPESRELSLALTHLEEVIMWANASVARNGLAKPE